MLLIFLQSNGQNIKQRFVNKIGIVSADTTIITSKPKYDTIRVLIAYADTSWVNHINDGYEYSGIIQWRLVYSIRMIEESFTFRTRESDFKEYKTVTPKTHIKYLTEDKKDIPKSWVIIPNLEVKL